MTIIKGTTPTIEYKFSEIDPVEITSAALTLKQYNRKVIERDLSTAVLGEASLLWTLTQKETLRLKEDVSGEVYLDYLVGGVVRGAGATQEFTVEPTGKNEVMT